MLYAHPVINEISATVCQSGELVHSLCTERYTFTCSHPFPLWATRGNLAVSVWDALASPEELVINPADLSTLKRLVVAADPQLAALNVHLSHCVC